MNSDSANKEHKRKDVDLWRIPAIVSIEAVHVRHREPMRFYVQSKPVESRETIEFIVRTTEEFPVRALSPALFVGDHAITEMSRLGENTYSFVAPETEIPRLKQNAAISLGWAGTRAKPTRTKYRFRIGREETR
jgi:hypothetical protein